MAESKYNALKIDHQLCFPLYACSREVIKRYTPYLDAIDLTYTQYITMLVLWENGSITARDLGMKLFLDSGTLTPLLKKLEQKGLVTRKRDAADERCLVVTATEEGMKLRDKAVDIPVKMAQLLTITSEEATTLYSILYKMLDGVDQA